MLEYFAKVWDGLDMIWTSLSFLERYYTIVAFVWVAVLIVRLIARPRGPEMVLVPVRLPDPEPAS